MAYYNLFCFILLSYNLLGQNITFTDNALKNYLVQELCVDTTSSGATFSAALTVDSNGDQEIQWSEALAVQHLQIEDFGDQYPISSLRDLSAFSNLQRLHVVHLDEVVEISQLQLPQLSELLIGSCLHLRRVDVSNLVNLTTSLRIEDIDTLDYLNIQNGSVAAFFSLFYSDNIHYACVDSLAAEYNEVAWKLTQGLPTLTNCQTLVVPPLPAGEALQFFPNPTHRSIQCHNSLEEYKLQLFNSQGQQLPLPPSTSQQVDFSALPTGVYYLLLERAGNFYQHKIIKL